MTIKTTRARARPKITAAPGLPEGMKERRQRRLLLVDDYEGVRNTMEQVLSEHGFDVVVASNVPDALRLCCNQKFDVLLCDLQMPRAGDGFTVVSAMRHCNPEAVNIVYSGYPALHAAMSEILLQADEILVKPLDIPEVISLINDRLSKERRTRREVPGDSSESIATLLQRESPSTIADWLQRVNGTPEIVRVTLSDEQRTAHLPRLFKDLIERLLRPSRLEAPPSNPAAARLHGKTRREQGYSAAQIVEESRILQVSIFKTLQSNLSSLDFSRVLFGVMAIADEVDAQLKQTMDSYIEADKIPA
jgi:CheY-like chemotaxis protein